MYREFFNTLFPCRIRNQLSGFFASWDFAPATSGSSHNPGTIPTCLTWSSTNFNPRGHLVADGSHAPMVWLQSSLASAYQPASMTKYSQPTFAAEAMSGNSLASVGSPQRQFM